MCFCPAAGGDPLPGEVVQPVVRGGDLGAAGGPGPGEDPGVRGDPEAAGGPQAHGERNGNLKERRSSPDE